MMYWTDWGTVGRIEKASMDGSDRQVVHDTNLVLPNGLAIDYQSQTLYWADASLDRIESSRVDGFNRVLLSSVESSHIFGIVFHQDMLYVSDWHDNTIRVVESSEGTVSLLKNVFTCYKPFGIQIVDLDRQPLGK